MRIKKLFGLLLLTAAIAMAGCGGQKVATQPAVPALTPEQQLALAKIGVATASGSISIIVSNLEKNPTANANKIKIYNRAKVILDEFNNQMANVTRIDLSTRDGVHTAINKVVDGADHLADTDGLQLNDPAIHTDIFVVVAIIKSAMTSFDVFFPATPAAGPTQ